MNDIVFIDIDTQFDFMLPSGKLYVKDAKALIPRLKALTNIAVTNDILIISSVDTHIKNDPEFKQFSAHCVIGTKGQKKIPQTRLKKHTLLPSSILNKKELFSRVNPKQLIVQKDNVYTFMDLNLFRILKSFKAVFVYGVALDYCVKAAVLDLFKAGLKVWLVTDATQAIDPQAGKLLLKQFKKNGVNLIRLKDVEKTVRRINRE